MRLQSWLRLGRLHTGRDPHAAGHRILRRRRQIRQVALIFFLKTQNLTHSSIHNSIEDVTLRCGGGCHAVKGPVISEIF